MDEIETAFGDAQEALETLDRAFASGNAQEVQNALYGPLRATEHKHGFQLDFETLPEGSKKAFDPNYPFVLG